MNKATFLEKYSINLAGSENKEHYLRYARAFLAQADAPNRASVDRYITSLVDLGMAPGTVNFAFRVVRTLFTVNGVPWEYRRGEAPAIGQRDEYRPQLSPRIIETMITAAKEDRLYPAERAFLALSTTYGLRREEMGNLKPKDLFKGAIYIATLKFGRERYHLIPPEVAPYIEQHDFSQVYALATLSQTFWKIIVKSGFRHLKEKRLGWHTIRRALFSGLIDNGVSALAARIFLRWKGSTEEMAMPARYYGNVVIDVEESPMLDEAKGDEDIFEKHPFLPYWRPKNGI